MRKGIIPAVLLALFLVGCATPSTQSNEAAGQTATPSTPTESATAQTQIVTETQEIPYETSTVDDSSLLVGTTQVRTAGANGVKTLTFEVTIVNREVTDKKLISEEITTQPVTEVVAVGTMPQAPPPPPPPPPQEPQPQCHPSYSGACVPFASDVDCEGGGGNGPAYVRGPVQVVGPDVYDLDRDGDGVACE
jgi:resuscitation-promoting factor RpfB